MKTLLKKVFLTFGLACAGSYGLHAQTYKLAANVPFAFHVGNSELSAGSYLIERSDNLDAQFLTNVNTRRKLCIMVGGSHWTNQQGTSRLVFRGYGRNFFLAEIWPSEGNGSKLKPGKAETALSETMASAHPEEVTVFLASVR